MTQTINGTDGNDTLTGFDPGDPANPDGIETILGGLADDTLSGLGGNDILDGGDGNDALFGGDGDDLLIGGSGGDTLNGGTGIDTVSYQASATSIIVDLVSSNASGSDDNDFITGVENIIGSDFGDILGGDDGANVISGGLGNDQIYGQDGADTLDGGDGIDTAFFIGPTGVAVNLATGTGQGGWAQGDVLLNIENLAGSTFADILTGDGGANGLVGNDGDDVLIGGAGADNLVGGPGIDTADYSTSPAGVTVNITAGTGLGGDAEGDTVTGMENLIGSAFADKLFGTAGANALSGGDGDDVLRGGGGADHLDGGAGLDQANYQGSAVAVSVDLLAGTAAGGDAQGDVLTGIENLYGSSHDDTLAGDNGRNVIGGELGNDTLVGNGGDDSLSGEGGDDALSGGDGADRLVGGDGVDTIHGGTGNDSVDAGTGNDQVFGEAGHDNIYGGAGDDTIDGGDGNDVIEGDGGADTIIGGAGIDTASYASSAAGVSVNLATGAMSGGDAAGDTLTGIEQVMGSAFADTLTGDANANTLWGLGGGDVLTGGGGGDALKGGAGADRFVYTALSDSAVSGIGKDWITDFSAGDKIDLSGIDADGNAANGDTAFTFGTGDFTRHAGELRVVTAGAIQVVYVDVNGDKAPDFAINVTADHALTASDFLL